MRRYLSTSYLRRALWLVFMLAAAMSFATALVLASGNPSPAVIEPVSPPPEDIPPGRMLIEGDMLAPLGNYTQTQGPRAPDAFYLPNLWPDGIIPYRSDANVGQVSRTLMIAAMQEWQAVANVRFQPCSPCTGAFVTILHNPTRNFSDLGRTGAEQFVNINAWNDKFVMVHELGHTLGLRHEHNRPDRDQYVITYTQNIMPGREDDFFIYTDAMPYGPYDFDSVMHYGACFAARDPAGCARSGGTVSQTIGLRPAYSGTVFGTQSHLTWMDKMIMAQLYPYPDWRFVNVGAAASGSGLTFFSPYQSFYDGTANVPSGGTVVVQPGTYDGAAIYTKPQTWIAPIGGVILK